MLLIITYTKFVLIYSMEFGNLKQLVETNWYRKNNNKCGIIIYYFI